MKKFGQRALMWLLYAGALVIFFFTMDWSFEPGMNVSVWQMLLVYAVLFLVLPTFNKLLLQKDKTAWHLYLISLGGGALMALAWPPLPFAALIFVGLIPWLYMEQQVSNPNSKFYGYNFFKFLYPGLLSWNILATYWVANSTLPGGILAFTLNALVMGIPWALFHKTKKSLGPYLGYLSLIVYFLCFEYLHMNWELTWPWLTIGNVFAKFPAWVQWYEFTGHLGGTLWVFGVNILFFSGIVSLPYLRQFFQQRYKLEATTANKFATAFAFARPLLLIFIPMGISYMMYLTYEEHGEPVEVTVVQPNIDPYIKYDGTARDQIKKFIALSEQGLTDSTDYVVWPESVLPTYVWLNKLERNSLFQSVVEFVDSNPSITMIIGVSALQMYDKPETPTARYFRNGDCCYDSYNAAMQIDTSRNYPIYIKSKLVPGVERLPYPSLTNLIAEYAFNFGGSTGSLGTQDTRDAFFNRDSLGIAPVVCYESVFGDYMTEYFRNGAELVFVITNDGWWQNSPGHVQHMHYASLRAIEARKDVARSANTGISCFINQRGDIRQQTQYWEDAVINSTMYANKEITFFVRYGDYIGRVAGFLSIFFILYTIVRSRTKKTAL